MRVESKWAEEARTSETQNPRDNAVRETHR